MVTITRRRAVEAYDNWRKKNGRAVRGSGTNSDKLFVQAINNQLLLAQDSPPHTLGIPTTRGGWGNWRTERDAQTKRIRRDVCFAIRVLTGEDITGNQELESEPVNATDMVRLGPAWIVPQDAGDQSGPVDLTVDWIDFKVGVAQDVNRALSKKSPSACDEKERIGSVRYALYEASLYAEGGEKLHHPMVNPEGSRKVELSIDRDDHLRWRVMPGDERTVLRGDLSQLTLATGAVDIGSQISVNVSVGRADIDPIFTIAADKTVSRNDEQRLRERLVEQVLRNRFADVGPRKRHVLSIVNAVRR